MTKLNLNVGGAMEDAASERFVAAWHRAERGESFRERHLSFESWEALVRVLTGKRLELLQHVHRKPAVSVRSLAKVLQRDYSNVYADVRALAAAGLLDSTKAGVRADYDVIETRIAI
jgi:predicted transcriptional regulator